MLPGEDGFKQAFQRLLRTPEFAGHPKFNHRARARLQQTVDVVAGLDLKPGIRHLDVGGGHMALLCRDLFGFAPCVGCATDADVRKVIEHGAEYRCVDFLAEAVDSSQTFDLITFLDVLEDVPVPAGVTLRKLSRLLRPGGWLVMTTPNANRIRNILRMLANKEVLDPRRLPEDGDGLGHPTEYTLRQMERQLRTAGMEIKILAHYTSGQRGASAMEQVAHLLIEPFNMFPHLRDGLMIVARVPEARETTE
jgi:SAM-dependent methyltransferase